MPKLKKIYTLVGIFLVLPLVMYTPKITCSSHANASHANASHGSAVVPIASHNEPFAISSSSDSSQDDTGNINIGGFNIRVPNFSNIFGSNHSSSPEEEAEDDILSETAISLAVPKHLSGKMASLKPFIKLVLRNKRSSPSENEEFISPLKRATSQRGLPVPDATHTRRPSVQRDRSDMVFMERNMHHADISDEQQQERNKMQQLLIEAAQVALEAKEAELKIRAKLLEEKELKLETKFSKKGTAVIATTASLITTLAGTLTAYYSSQK